MRLAGLRATLVVVLVIAGPVAVHGDSFEASSGSVTTTPARSGNITVTGGTLPVEPEPVFARVRELVNADATPPRVIHLTSPNATERPVRITDEFYRAMGIRTAPPVSSSDPSGYTVQNRVYLAPKNGTPAQIERTLAHEFTHTIQLQSSAFTPPVEDTTTDTAHVTAALVEGGATYVSDEYTKRYLPHLQLASERVRMWYANAPAAMKLRLAAYRFGSRYINQRLSTPANLSTVYATPPATTEQLIHGLTPAGEPPTSLQVTSGNDTSQWARSSVDRMGELSVRVILGTHLSDQRAATAAAGWGNDSLLQYSNSNANQSGFAWVLRWDDAQNATQFETAFGQYLESRANLTNGVWMDERMALRGDRVDERTFAVFVGPRSFVTNATAKRDGREIRICVES